MRLLGPGGGLAAALAGYEDRPSQREMAAAVGRALADRHPLLVEAGTGTGKTLAYLVPAIESGLRVVVSTGTRALQEQLSRKDLPLAAAIFGRPIESVTLKGVANYVCRRKLREVEHQTGLFAAGELGRALAWARASESGDRSEHGDLGDDHPLWRDLTTTPEARLGPRCPFFERCFVTRARRRAEASQIVVVNHHLFFADLALRHATDGGKVLPDYDAVVFDEAHLLEEVMTDHFGLAVSTTRIALYARDLAAAFERTDEALGRAVGAAGPLAPRLDALHARSQALFDRVRPALGHDERTALPADLFASGERRAAWLALDEALDEVAGFAQRRGAATRDDDDERASAAAEELAALGARGHALRDALAALAEPSPERASEHVAWGEARAGHVALHAAPVDVSAILRARVLADTPAAIFTSATISAAGSFAYARARLGLPEEACDALAVDSPFDYARQAMLYIPRDLPPPGEPGAGARACARMRELVAITTGRAFLLFTSHRALREAEVALADLSHPLLVQGQASPTVLLERFRTRPGAVLLATGTFWSGVDVPGDALSLVVMDKLPFAPPNDPLIAARARRIAEQGGEPFADYQLPAAALTFKQGFGRLIRRRDDRGIVAVLDSRLLAKGYGRTFLASLPKDLPRTAQLEPLRRWFVGDDAGRPAAIARETGPAPASVS